MSLSRFESLDLSQGISFLRDVRIHRPSLIRTGGRAVTGAIHGSAVGREVCQTACAKRS